jgi:SulP family sulfate permease
LNTKRTTLAGRSRLKLTKLLPFLAWGAQINPRSLWADLMAGLTGAIIGLPQGIAYALIAGLPPEYGLYSAIITPIVAALFGSSRHLVSGPAAAISIVILSVVSAVVPPDSIEFIPAVLCLTLLTGLFQLGLGLARLGTLVNFISHTVVIGFTAGAAVLIATSQFKYALGVQVPSGSSFFESWAALVSQIDATNPYTLTIAVITILATLLVKRINPKLPAMLIGMVAGSLGCWLIGGADHNVALVGALSGQLPSFSLPALSGETLSALIPGALAVAILGLVEAVSIARAVAIRSGQRIHSDQEFIGQGLSNIIGSLFSCFAGSGSFTRTGINYDSGAQTPLAAIFAALTLVLILLLAPDITVYLPLPAMGGAILLIAWRLIDTQHIAQILRSNKQETAVLLVTFFATLIVQLEFAIYLGVCLSLILYLRKTSRPRIMEVAPKSLDEGTDMRSIERFDLSACPQLTILRIDGSIFFGAVDHIQQHLQQFIQDSDNNRHLLILCSGVNFIDLAGAEMLAQESQKMENAGNRMSFCALKNTVKDELIEQRFFDMLGADNFYATVDDALEALVENTLVRNRCASCPKSVFKQCPTIAAG